MDISTPESFLDAVKNGRLEEVEECLRMHPDWANFIDIYGWTPLHYAALNGNKSIVKPLLQAGCHFDALTKSGRTPLHNAASNGRDSIAKLLKAVGARVSNFDHLSPDQIKMLQEPIPEEEILEIRFTIYFDFSLLDRLLFLV